MTNTTNQTEKKVSDFPNYLYPADMDEIRRRDRESVEITKDEMKHFQSVVLTFSEHMMNDEGNDWEWREHGNLQSRLAMFDPELADVLDELFSEAEAVEFPWHWREIRTFWRLRGRHGATVMGYRTAAQIKAEAERAAEFEERQRKERQGIDGGTVTGREVA